MISMVTLPAHGGAIFCQLRLDKPTEADDEGPQEDDDSGVSERLQVEGAITILSKFGSDDEFD